jgi:hypothetical protein
VRLVFRTQLNLAIFDKSAFPFWDEARMVDLGFMYPSSGKAPTPAEYPENRDLAFRWASIMQNGKSFTSDFPTINQN